MSVSLMAVAKRILSETTAEVVSTDDVFDSVIGAKAHRFSYSRNELKERTRHHEKFGVPYLNYCDHVFLYVRVREAVEKAIEILSEPWTFRQRELAMTRFGVGDCNQLATLATMKAAAFCYAKAVVLCNRTQAEYLGSGNSREVEFEQVVFLSDKPLEFTVNCPIADLFEKARGAVILDCYLKVICFASEYRKTRIQQCIQSYDLSLYAGDGCTVVKNDPRVSSWNAQADRIAAKAAQLLAGTTWLPKYFERSLQVLFVQKMTHKSVIALLGNWFPGTMWKHRMNDNRKVFLSMVGSNEQTKKVSDQLKALETNTKRYATRDKETKQVTSYRVYLCDPPTPRTLWLSVLKLIPTQFKLPTLYAMTECLEEPRLL